MEIWKNLSLEDMEGEVWKDIEGYEGLYQVSNMGRIKSLEKTCNTYNGKGEFRRTVKERIRAQTFTSGNYLHVCLSKNGIHKTQRIHRLVAKAFLDNPLNKETVDHINTIRTDNRVCNLKWATQSEQFTDNEISKERMRISRSENGRKTAKERQKLMVEALKRKVRCITTGKEFKSITEAAKYYNAPRCHIGLCCMGKYKTAGKLPDGTRLKWEYVDKN